MTRCRLCGKEFVNGSHRYCDDCSAEYSKHCCVCGREFKTTRRKEASSVNEWCSLACRNKDPRMVAQVKATLLSKYGVDNPMRSPIIKAKTQQTNLERYGVTVATKIDSVKNKIKETNLARYGNVCSRWGTEPNAKAQQTSLRHWGTDHPWKNKELWNKALVSRIQTYGNGCNRAKAESTNLAKYGLTVPANSPTNMQRRIVNNQAKYGVDHLIMLPIVRFKNGNSVTKVNRRWQELLSKATGLDWELEYSVAGRSFDLRYGNLLIEINPTATHQSSLSFAEFTGIAKYSDKVLSKDYHYLKAKLAHEHGYDLIMVWDWLPKHKVIDLVKSKLKLLDRRIYARDCSVGKVPAKTAARFYRANHIQNQHQGRHTGLFLGDELVACMTWSGNELVRFASLNDTLIIGAYSKLFKHSAPTGELISFSFNDYSTGNIYRNNGWELDGEVRPRYWWVKGKDVRTRRSCQKKYILQEFGQQYSLDANMTEREMMLKLGYTQIYDSGKLRWKLVIH